MILDEVSEVEAPPANPIPRKNVPPPTPRWHLLAIGLGRWVTGLRRSTVLIVLGVAVIAASLITALTLIDRVQTDPLQVGATQVARLSVDDGYEIPEYFTANDSGSGIPETPPQGFYGLRALLSTVPLFYAAGGNNTCLAIYPEEGITTTANSFNGRVHRLRGRRLPRDRSVHAGSRRVAADPSVQFPRVDRVAVRL